VTATSQSAPPGGNALSAQTAAGVVTGFFDAYRAHDVDGMTGLCSITCDFSYVPFEVWGKQRVLRGDGKVGTVGKVLWAGLINSFPNLSNTVHTIVANDEGDVVVEADIEGTQQLAWGAIVPAGKHYCEPHLFVFHVGDDLLIDSITGYWDNAGISKQLGHLEVD
jgi:ketosteroid isomerase-like protein